MSEYDEAASRFLDRVEKTDTCWWFCFRNGERYSTYGMVQVGDRSMGAHRFSYILHRGDLPDELIIRHTCDNPACVNPDHLIPGTNRENRQDYAERGPRRERLEGVPVTIRVSDELAAQLAEVAKAAHRSVNGHVIHLIEQDVKAAAAAKKEAQDK